MMMDNNHDKPISLVSPCNAIIKPTVVGIYGIPGSGKSFFLDQMKKSGCFKEGEFTIFEGSEVIESVLRAANQVFHQLQEQDKMRYRKIAIDTIRDHCISTDTIGIVAGHYMFWDEGKPAGNIVWNSNDQDVYTHIFYLKTPVDSIYQYRQDDTERCRPPVSLAHLQRWQRAEISSLRDLCYGNGILFSAFVPDSDPTTHLSCLLNFGTFNEEENMSRVKSKLDEIMSVRSKQLETMLVFDGDRTLAAEDTGKLFWESVPQLQEYGDGRSPLEKLFSGPMGYSFTAFQQATLLYEEMDTQASFYNHCSDVALKVVVHPDIVALLRRVAEQEVVGAVIITCGLQQVWVEVLAELGLTQAVKLIGGGRIDDDFVVTAEVKAALVNRLQDVYNMYVWAFGDSVLDLGMLREADRAIVVVGNEQTRSKTMDAALEDAITNGGLRARQVLLPGNVSPRLDTAKLPIVRFTDRDFKTSIFVRKDRHVGLKFTCAMGKSAAMLLMTPTRDVSVSGPTLRKVHKRIGWYLAIEYLADVIGIDKHPITHVQGHQTSGWCVRQQDVLVVALMRGGEPMALGVSEVLPQSMFLHAKNPQDLGFEHLQGHRTVVLVDSVVNNGNTVVNFVRHICQFSATVNIVIIAGVVQANAISKIKARIEYDLICRRRLDLIALRLSENQYSGQGVVDTGNRLFGTTHML